MSDAGATGRADPGHVLPVALPREFHRFATPAPGRGAGRTGQIGLMELTFAPRGGVTRLVHHYQQPPLQIFRPLYHDPARPDLACVILMQLGGGMVQGDRYRLDLTCQAGAAAHLTTQSAGKLYKCEENFIAQVVNLTAGAGSVIEYLPDPTIPYRGSRFFQHLAVRLDPTATVIVGEILTPGRIASGERHAYEIYHTRMEVHDLGGRPLVADTIKLAPGQHWPAGPALLGPYDVFGVLSVFSRQLAPAVLTTRLREALAGDPAVRGATRFGVSELPNGCGVAVRLLGTASAAVEHARTVAWNAARLALLGAPAPEPRRG